MTLNKWDPLRDLLNFQERMNRLMGRPLAEGAPSASVQWRPAFDVLETDDAYILRADLPGVGRDRINIEVKGGRLSVYGERPLQGDSFGTAYLSVERAAGSFERSFNLPGIVDVERSEAKYEDGVLEILLPKAPREGPLNITVVCVG
jgi:HSP20 family protein